MKTPQDHTSLPRPEQRYRARELGVPLGRFRPGKWNAITDVEGVLVGHSTIIRGAGPLRRGKGPVRTGVTAILPNEQNVFEQRLIGGGFVLNGAGEVSGMTQLIEWGLVETPIFLTNTLSVGQVSDAAVQWMVDQFPGIGGEHDVLIPLVGECDDSWLNDVAGRHVLADNVLEALHTASSGPVAEGSVGGGTGMICCDFKAGIGTSSRKLPPALGSYTVGVLVMSNFGHMRDLRIAGFPVGPVLEERYREIPKRETSLRGGDRGHGRSHPKFAVHGARHGRRERELRAGPSAGPDEGAARALAAEAAREASRVQVALAHRGAPRAGARARRSTDRRRGSAQRRARGGRHGRPAAAASPRRVNLRLRPPTASRYKACRNRLQTRQRQPIGARWETEWPDRRASTCG